MKESKEEFVEKAVNLLEKDMMAVINLLEFILNPTIPKDMFTNPRTEQSMMGHNYLRMCIVEKWTVEMKRRIGDSIEPEMKEMLDELSSAFKIQAKVDE